MTTHTKTLIALVGMIVGVIVGEKVIFFGSEIAGACLFLGVIQLLISFFERHVACKNQVQGEGKINTRVARFSIPLASGIFFMAIALLTIRIQFEIPKNDFVCEKICEFTATLTSSPAIKNEYQIFSVQPDTETDVYDVQVKAPLYPKFEVGERVTLIGKVTASHTLMPHDGKKMFDYTTYLQVHSIGSEMLYPKVMPLGTSTEGYSFVTKLQHTRENFVESISMYVNEPAASLASGMLFGVASMSEELTQIFRNAGISHIVVLSGFNIAILISFVLLIFVFMPLFLRIFFAGSLVILFVLMVGGEASIVRATIMSFIGLAALLVGRAYVARQALLLSLILIIVYEPIHLLHDVSLHLSFLATAGIVYMSDGVKIMLHKIHSTTYQEIIATTVCAYLATLPYIMYTFGTVSVYALLTNFIVLPFVPLAMLLTLLVVVIAPLSTHLTSVIGYVDTLLGDSIIFVAHTVARLPFASVTVSISFTQMCVGYSLLIGVYIFCIRIYTRRTKNETLLTKQNEIVSEVISY